MLLWGLMVSSVDNVIKPLLISRGVSTPMIIVMFGVFGGALAFGLIGLFIGPTVLALGYTLLQESIAPAVTAAATVPEPAVALEPPHPQPGDARETRIA